MLDSLLQSSDPSVMAASTMISAVGLGLFLKMPRRRRDLIRR
jgi:hypothetical protein